MLIGISGKIGSGKDALADFIIKNSKIIFEKVSFAYKLKLITSIMSGQPLEIMFTQEGKNIFLSKWGFTVGEMQQLIGTEAMRDSVHKDAWTLALFADYNSSKNWVISDMRFPNEAEAVRKRNGILIRITGDPANIRKNSQRNLNHASETSLDSYNKWNYEFKNTGTLDSLEDFSKTLLKNNI